MMKSKSLKEFLREKYHMTLDEYEALEDELLIEEILDGYDRIKSIPDKKSVEG